VSFSSSLLLDCLSFALRVDLYAQHSTLVFLVCIAGSQREEL
jgi:hypothetical protein